MPSGKSNSSSGRGSTQGGSSGSGNQNNYGIVRDGWGTRPNFQASYGLDMSTQGIEQGNAILDGFRQQDRAQGGNSGQKR